MSNLDTDFSDVNMIYRKKKLLELVFAKAKEEIPNGSKSSIAAYISSLFEEKFGFSKDERTFVRYYRSLVENNEDYNIDDITLDQLCNYIEYKNFKEFCEKIKVLDVDKKENTLNVTISNETDVSHASISEKISKIVINIHNTPIIKIPEFVSRHSNSFGLVGILIVLGFVFKKNDAISDSKTTNKKDSATKILIKEKNDLPHSTIHFANMESANHGENSAYERKKECMYWNEDHYEEVFCNEIIEGKTIIATNNDTKLLKKINSPDTLTAENALGKVWYDKSNKKVTFFTHYGLNPENGKTLKPATEYILETYAKK